MNDSENLNYSKKTVLFYAPLFAEELVYSGEDVYVSELNLVYQLIFACFFMCALYTFSFLPYGRFYNRLGGNISMLGAYFFMFSYLIFPSIRQPRIFNIYSERLYRGITVRNAIYAQNNK